MTTADSLHVDSHRSVSLWKKFCNKKYRDGYVSSHVKKFLAHQITALRGEKSQTEFGEIIGKPQSVVCRLENPNYGKYSLQTLLDVASKLNLALIVRFVDFPTFLKGTSDFSVEAVRPAAYDEHVNNPELATLNDDYSAHAHASAAPATGQLIPSVGGIPEASMFLEAWAQGSATVVVSGLYDAVKSSSAQPKLDNPQREIFAKAAYQWLPRTEGMPKAA